MFYLTIVRSDGREVRQVFGSDQIMVGRHENCNLRLLGSMVSRSHCLIFHEGKRYLVKDLGSRNGTWVNGRKIRSRKQIKKGDAIQVGPFRIFLEPGHLSEAPEKAGSGETVGIRGEQFEHKDETEEVKKPLGIINNYLAETTGHLGRIPTEARRQRLNRNLLTLYSITQDLVVTRDLDEILDHIMDRLFETFSPSQATILLMEKDGIPVPRKQRPAQEKERGRSVSTTVLNRVMNDRVGVLTDNALEDPRFELGDSVIVDGIRSVMAAPIWEDEKILGMIYVDSLDLDDGYQPEDLDLLTAIGHQAALAIQRWKLTERLSAEAVKVAVIREQLKRFHSPRVVDQILKGAADLEVRETIATIFFCDIVDFSSLCASGNPDQLQKVLNLFCKTVNEVVFQEQGTLDKFMGDAAMAIFGAPLPQRDAPVRAVRCALKIREQLKFGMAELPPGLRFQVRYGINTGEAVVGNFGSDERIDYTVLGKAVNVAARICKIADPDRILIGPGTFEAIKDRRLFQLRQIDYKRLKGLTEKVELVEVDGVL